MKRFQMPRIKQVFFLCDKKLLHLQADMCLSDFGCDESVGGKGGQERTLYLCCCLHLIHIALDISEEGSLCVFGLRICSWDL